MRELRDVLHEAFNGHARALGDAGVEVEPASALSDIRRRRARRSVLAVGGAAAACGAIAFAAVAVPGMSDGSATVAAPSDDGAVAPSPADHLPALPPPQDGAPQWCYLDAYPAPNPEAFGPAGYTGRVYEDYADGVFVHVSPDGSVEVVEDADQGSPAMPWEHMAMDSFGSGGGGRPYLVAPEGPGLAYEWTTVAPDEVPSGVNPGLLMRVHTLTLGFSGTGLEPAVAGADAVVESVIRYDDGEEIVVEIGRGEPGATINDYDGLVSASIRATMPSGESYEITSYYDASQTYEAACGVPVPILADDTREDYDPGPEAVPEPEPYVRGPYLEGPEAEMFQCLAAIPDDLVAQPTRLERQTGSYYDVEEAGIEFDFGDGGYILAAPEETFAGADVPGPQYSGWGGGYGERNGEINGNVTYEALVWVDDEGRIVGVQDHLRDEDTGRVSGQGDDTISTIGGGSYSDRTWYIGDVSSLAVPCKGVDDTALEAAELALIYGYGPSENDITWAVYFPERG